MSQKRKPQKDISPEAGDREGEMLDSPRMARRLKRRVLKAALATLDRESGHPHASLILAATAPDGAPVFLVSTLAVHTRNLEADPRASVLIDVTGSRGDPLEGARLTVLGRAARIDEESERARLLARFLARHPEAEGYAGFADFAIWRLAMERGHLVAGFGRISPLDADALATDIAGAEALIAAEPDILAHMNADHADAIAAMAAAHGAAEADGWRMTGIDPEGCDLLRAGEAIRIDFPEPVRGPDEARQALVALARAARSARSAGG